MMLRKLGVLLCFGTIVCCHFERAMCQLPNPHYQRKTSDPKWLADAVQFHGHLGPWAVAGLRAGMAARQAVRAEGYFDVEVTVEGPLVKPPQSCFLDGLQVSTGATLGKRNLKWTKADRIVVRVKNTRTGKMAEVRPTSKLLQLVASVQSRTEAIKQQRMSDRVDEPKHQPQQRDDHLLEGIARQIAGMPEKKILRVTLMNEWTFLPGSPTGH